MSSDSTEELWRKVAAEASLAKPGGDEGLLPVYSLLGDLVEALEPETPEHLSASKVREEIEELFLTGGNWNEEILQKLHAFLQAPDSPGDTGEASYSETDPETTAAPMPAVEASPNATADASQTVDAIDPAETDVVMELDLDENRELLEEFVNEASEHLDEIEGALLKVEQDPEEEESIHSLFRSFHTIKGVSGFLLLVPINKLSHDVESLLDLARNHKLLLNSDIISVLLQARDRLLQLVQQVQQCLQDNSQPDQLIPVSDLIDQVRRLSQASEAPATASTDEGPDEAAVPAPETTPAVPTEELPSEAAPATTPAAPNKEEKAQDAAVQKVAGQLKDTSIRVNIDKLDTLVDSVGELVILESQLLNSLESVDRSDNSELQKHLNQLRRIVRSLQEDALAIRMVPVRQTFRKMERLARELSRNLGKHVELTLSGEDTELDRTMVEVIGDPLVHMIRNAVDHGLEDGETRKKNGKSESGHIQLSAFHQGGYVVLELRDDGRGLNADRIYQKAMDRGLITPNKKFSREEIYHFIFLPGFSTAEKIT